MSLEKLLASYGLVHQRSSLVPKTARIYYDRQRKRWHIFPVNDHPFAVKGESWWAYGFEAAEKIAGTLLERDFNDYDIAYLSKKDLEQYNFYKEISK